MHDGLETTLKIVFELDSWHGITDGIFECERCHQFLMLEMIDWSGPGQAIRIYMTATVATAVVNVFLRNARSDYCDLTRHGQEVDALLAHAKWRCLTVLDCHSLKILKLVPLTSEMKLVNRSWREALPGKEDTYWFDQVGMAKR